jgi:hypothetical protein
MYCPYCGSAIADDAQFCRSCGKPQSTPKNPIEGSEQRTTAPQNFVFQSQNGKPGLASRTGYLIGRHPIWTIFILLIVLWWLSSPLIKNVDTAQQSRASQQSNTASSPAETWTPGIGETAKITSLGGGSDVLAFVSEDALKEYKTASLGGQDSGQAAIQSLIAAGKVLATRRGTSVSVVSASGWNGWHKVRFVNGEHAGEAAYLLDQWTVYSK